MKQGLAAYIERIDPNSNIVICFELTRVHACVHETGRSGGKGGKIGASALLVGDGLDDTALVDAAGICKPLQLGGFHPW